MDVFWNDPMPLIMTNIYIIFVWTTCLDNLPSPVKNELLLLITFHSASGYIMNPY